VYKKNEVILYVQEATEHIVPFKLAKTAFGIHPILRKHNDDPYH